ncbi:DUF6124 family protein [Pseudomonas helleri]|jgi:hypothetical protein|uniref:DUF3077 domain-containing protein n=1 Tax=Pseudomonas helleri TaxID=1608996 RepID=A0A6I1WV80_9PSED|nr:DUF3077 domain-containing protein [Pseudomonas helleri]MQT34748.1 DUF3077 domain-containing protein [Pseudomonas helleri]MQT72893.1 DUF3077 domain-containing protein [Pseudomonas helleri]MQU04337.1 DUF3077 domain-containing protein [Pseudomonas helleri]MQU19635.1 DUF3077 domain-containing protein [Pseudomonas helleri]MQU42832.1 DUF3077 domain-containing protein [Pseudomonas helleri]
MKKLVPDPPIPTLQDAAQCDALSLDRAATDRALDYYLLNHKPPRHVDQATYAIPDSVNLEAALAQASDLLRCAGASASEAGNGLSGHPRHLVLSVMHLVELAKAYVDKSLDGLTTH